MPSIRVHELAKEFGMDSKELLDRLHAMKIPAKSHSSTLVDAYIDRVRKKLGPEIEQRAAEAEAARAEEEITRAREEQQKREEEEAARKAAVETERRARESERIEREIREAEEAEAALAAEADMFQVAPVDTAPKSIPKFAGLLSQIEAERSRLDAEKKAKQEAKRASDKNKGGAVRGGAGTGAGAGKGGTGAGGRGGMGAGKQGGAGFGKQGAGAYTEQRVGKQQGAGGKGGMGAGAGGRGGIGVGAGGKQGGAGAGFGKQGLGAGAYTEQRTGKQQGAGLGTAKQGGAAGAGAGFGKQGLGAGAYTEQRTGKQQGAGLGAAKQGGAAGTGAGAYTEQRTGTYTEQRTGKQQGAGFAKQGGAAGAGVGAGKQGGAAGTGAGGLKGAAPASAAPASRHGVPAHFAAAPTTAPASYSTAHPTTVPASHVESELSGDKIVRRDGKKPDVRTGTEEAKQLLSRKGGKTRRTQYDTSGDEERENRSSSRRKTPGKGGERRTAVHHYVDTMVIDEDSSEDERYRQMAIAAEQLQRERVIADARAAVEAAETEGGGRRRKRKEKRVAEAKERAELEAIERGLDPEIALDSSLIQITSGITVQGFADAIGIASKDIVKKLFLLGSPFTITQTIPDEFVELIAADYDVRIRLVSHKEEYSTQIHDNPSDLLPRPPVVTVMGHVDHGKTSLLDAIRSTGVVATEAGGITQHIGASIAEIKGRRITFIDTPGHEAFTAMRARGAKVTDVVVLVVAADDGVMPQTIEAINHAQAAGVPIVVAVNKIDKPSAAPDRVRQELSEYGIITEEWGGQNMFVDVSAKQRIAIDDLLELILLQADVLELKANPNALASGFVIEAKLDKGRGPVATVLVQRGTLKVGDAVVVGTAHGRVRALINPFGATVDYARPADPVEIVGLGSVPDAGDEFRVFADERDARNLAEDRALRQRLSEHQKKSRVSLEDLFSRIEQDKLSELNLVVKADVQGSIEALSDALGKMDQSEVRINVIHSAVGGITETDVTLALASNAIVIGFNVRPAAKAKALADKERVEIKTYRVIYQAIEEINAARVGLLAPDIVERDTGMAEVRELFRVPRVGTIAGCMVTDGEISRDDRIRIVRAGTVVHEGSLASLRRFKEDVKMVRAGYECGIGIDNYQDLKLGDILEAYKVTVVAREA